MEPDLDDTRLSVPRSPLLAPEIDLDDTVIRGAVAPAPFEDDTAGGPPALVEPPAPGALSLPLLVDPIVPADLAPLDPVIPHYRVVLPDGAEVPIDATVYVGRKPSIPRIHVGPPPRLVTLASPGREMSATHLELTVVGGSLVASDMRSTNGTVVHLPGAGPRTLIRGESAVVIAGTRIDLGEGAVLDIRAAEAAS